ncbi:hypothetical protein F5X99DRAFT_411463 [Biscogniauxia marginata]|nr:hypothetical protein F5X99DRAFT_411463 [Biscogniauxia marginata]
MSYRKEKAVRHLKALADNYRSTNPLRKYFWRLLSRRIDYSAKDLVNLVKESSDSTKRRNHRTFRRFARNYGQNAAQDMNQVDLPRLLEGYMHRLDRLFFFSLLTRRVSKRRLDSSFFTETKSLVELKVIDAVNQEMSGYWDPKLDRIDVWTRHPNGDRESFAAMIDTLAHEMVHAFLDIFSDDTHDKHHIWVDTKDGHGVALSVELRGYRSLAHRELRDARRISSYLNQR